VTRRTARSLAWGTCALTLALTCGVVVLSLLSATDLGNLSFSIVGVASAVVGGLVASRRPGNPVGWLFLGGALFSALRALTAEYAVYGILTAPGALPLSRTAAGLSHSMELVGPVLLFILVPLYFPTGRPVSRRWGLVAWLALGMLPVMTLLQAVSPGEAVSGSGIPNPWAIEVMRPVVEALAPLGFAYYIGLIFASAASLILRLWRSRGEERQQIKWFTFAAAFIPVWFLTNEPIERVSPGLFAVMDALVITAVPVAVGIAILRYRLYDIDVIINRTLVYGVLTLLLALIYFGGIALMQGILIALTGQQSQLAVVASTLVIAALFNPLRGRIQSFIDRRFYRRKYDAARTLEEFSARLREETDLDRLGGELVGVVRETMEPGHASLWLRPLPDGTERREGESSSV
jgi:hypothetical protein